VADLRERGFVQVSASATSGREKAVTLTPLAVDFLDARRGAARAIERDLRADVGDDGFASLERLLGALDDGTDARLGAYLRLRLHD
jgi:DNA-binding MarR family transcriptional regulator